MLREHLQSTYMPPYTGSTRNMPAMQSGNILILGQQAWIVGFLALLLLHAACYLFVVFMLSEKGRFAQLKRDPQLAAHFLPQLVCFVIAAWYGTVAWVSQMPAAASFSIGSYLPQGERIACLMISFQLYELLACVPCPVGSARFAAPLRPPCSSERSPSHRRHIFSPVACDRRAWTPCARSGCAGRKRSYCFTT